MSYILDALRKADAEREQGEVPGLHTQTHVPSEPPRPHPLNRQLLWAVAALTSLLILILVWVFSRHEGPPPAPLPAPTPPTQEAQPAKPMQPEPAATAATPLPQAAIPQTPTAPIYPPLEASTQAEPPPLRAPTPPVVKAAPAATPTAPSPVDESHRIYKLQELPDAIRKELPTISIGGAMYSDTPSQRILIINGQVLHEGDQAAPGLKLDEIKLKSAVFQFKNYRYVVTY